MPLPEITSIQDSVDMDSPNTSFIGVVPSFDELYSLFKQDFEMSHVKLDKAKAQYVKILNHFNSNPIKIYRGIRLHPDAEVENDSMETPEQFVKRIKKDVAHEVFGGVGIYWSWNKGIAQNFDGLKPNTTVVLEGEVDKSQVDWGWTIILNMMDEWRDYRVENEVRVKEGAKVQLDKVWVGDKAIPVNKVVTANKDIAYHGSPVLKEVDSFKPSNSGELGAGLYFTRSESLANNYSTPRGEVENIAVAESKRGVAQLDLSGLKLRPITKSEYLEERNKFYDNEQALNNGEWNIDVANTAEDKLIKQYESEGYDGLEVADEQQGVIFPNSINKVKHINKTSASLQYESDNIRLGYIKEALSGKPVNSEDLVTIEVADDYILYEEEWVDACWEALYQKADYKGLGQNEAIAKFMKERFAQIVAEAGEKILYWEFDGDTMFVKISRSGKQLTAMYTDNTITSPEELFKLSTEHPEEDFDGLTYQDSNVDALLYILAGGRLEIHNWDRTGGSATDTLKKFRKMFPEIVAVGVEEGSDSQSYWNHMIEKGLIEGYYTYGMEFINEVIPMKKTSAYNDELGYTDPEVPMTDEDIENINTTDAVPTQNAMDMTKIPHPEAFKEVESKGVFFIGGDSVNVDPRGDETPFGIDYPNHFNGWAVGANVGQKLKKKADEGYYYVAVVSYPSNSSMHVNPSFISAMERKLKSLCDYVGVSYTQVMNEAEHYFQEQEAEKQKEELKTKKKTTGQDTLFEEDALVGNKEVKKDLTFYKKVIDLLKKREVEDIKERGGNVRTDAKISIKNVLLEVETEISHKNTEQYKGNIVGVAKFAEVITGKDRVVKHEVYPEEIIFNNWKMLPEPIPVAELFSALKSKVKPEDIQKTFWVMLQTYNLTVTKDHPIAQFLMDFAEEGMTKTSGSNNVNNLSFPLKVYRGLALSDASQFKVNPTVEDFDIEFAEAGDGWTTDLEVAKTFGSYVVVGVVNDIDAIDLKETARRRKRWSKDNENEIVIPDASKIEILGIYDSDKIEKTSGSKDAVVYHLTSKYNIDSIKQLGVLKSDRSNWHNEEDSIYLTDSLQEAREWKSIINDEAEESDYVILQITIPASETDKLKRLQDTRELVFYDDIPASWIHEVIPFEKTSGIEKIARKARQDDSLPVINKLISMGYDKASFHIHELLHKEIDICDAMNGKIIDLKKLVSGLRFNAPIFELTHPNCLDKETQIYTDQGWKYFYDLDKTEKVATLNTETFEMEYQKPTTYIKNKYEGEMCQWKSKTMDALTTPNHRWFLMPTSKKVKNKFLTSEELSSDLRDGLRRNYKIPSFVYYDVSDGDYVKIGSLNIASKNFALLMGYFLSEGYTEGRGKNKIGICQENKLKRDKIYKDIVPFLTELGINVTSNDREIRFSNRDLHEYLHPLGKALSKYIPLEVKNLSKDNLIVFLDAFLFGDGHVRENSNYKGKQHASYLMRVLYTSSDRMASDFTEVIMKAGFSPSYSYDDRKIKPIKGKNAIISSKGNWQIYLKNRTTYSTSQIKVSKIPYDDYVYCVTVPNSTILVRRGGKVYWTGNCYCYLLCYSTTNPDLEVVVVDWTGIEEGGRVVDRADAGERRADFERLFDKYREDLDNIENNSYIHGEFGEPEAGIYSFDLTMYDDTYFNVNELQEIRDKVLELVLDRADRYGIVVEDAEIAGNHMIVQTSAMLRNYDFSKEDWVEVEWTYNKRREELINVIMDLSKLQDWLKVTQDSINNLLLEIEQKNANQQMDKFSRLRKEASVKTTAFSSLPEDMQTFIFEWLETYTDGNSEVLNSLNSSNLPIVNVDVSSFKHITPLDKGRGLSHAKSLIGEQYPPVVIAHGKLVDGRHRMKSAILEGKGSVPAIDLSGLVPFENMPKDFFNEPVIVTSGLKKTSKLNLNTIRQFFTQERDRGVVDDKILDELQVDLIMLYEEIYKAQIFLETQQNKGLDLEEAYDLSYDNNLFPVTDSYFSNQAGDVLAKLKKAKTDKEKIIAINEALHQYHADSGKNILTLYDEFFNDYNALRNSLGRLKAIQAHHMRFIVAGRVDFLREKFMERYINGAVENIKERMSGAVPSDIEKAIEEKIPFIQKDMGEEFDELVKADPTKNKQYLQWIIKQFDIAYNGGRELGRFMEDLPKIKSYLEAYYKLSLQKKDLGTEEKVTPVFAKDGQPKMNPETGTPMVTKKTLNLSNIDHVENWQKLQDLVKPYLYGKGVELSDTEKEIVNNEANLVYDGKNWQIWVPNTEKSACILGKGTEWCTTYGYEGGRYPNQTQNQFNSYNDDDDLIIIINKQKPDWKYQWHFASGQFMNRDDKQMDIKTFLNRDAQEIKEPLYEYLINRQEKDAFNSYPNPENEEDAMYGTIPDGHVDAIEKKVNNLLQVDAPLDGIMPYIKALPKKDKDQLLGSARLLPKVVESGVVSEKEANKHVNTSELFFKDGKAYWIADDFGSDKILNLFHESSDSDYRTWAKNVLGDDVDPSDYYPEGVDINDCTDYFDLISKENIKRIGLHFKKQGVKTGKFDYSVLEDILTNPENYDYPDTDDVSDALVKAFSVAKEDANRSATFSGFIKEIERVVGGKYVWIKINGESKLAFPIDVYKFSDGFTMPSSDEGTVILDNVSDIIRQSLRKNSALLKPNGGENFYGDIKKDSDISYLNDKISEELDDLGIPKLPEKPIKKVKKALNKILREGIFRKKSMLEKLSRLGGFTVEAEKIIDVKKQKVSDVIKRSILDMLEEMNSNRDYQLTFHFKQQLKARAPEHEQSVMEFIKNHTYTANEVSEVQLDDKYYFRKLLFEIRTPANVTGVEDVIYLVVNEHRALITFFSKSSTGQRVTTPQRYVKPNRTVQEV